MIKDRGQKSLALKYAVGKRWFPQLEVDVLPKLVTTASQKALTDVDVLASIPDEFEGYRTVVIDCKTSKKESPIARALWVRGLMDQIGATRGLCVLDKDSIESDHRYCAAQFGVVLLAQDEFPRYAEATGSRLDSWQSNCASIDLWERFVEIGRNYFVLAPTVEFITSQYWTCRSDSEACRKVVAETVRVRPEVDPAKPEHIALVFDLAALFAHSLSKIVAKVFASYLQPKNRDELSGALLTLLYGGRENYEHLNSLKGMIKGTASGESPLTLPEWDRFLQLVRHGLDAPTELPHVALLIREVGWSFLNKGEQLGFAAILAQEKRQAAKLALLIVEYVTKAAKLPPEFGATSTRLLLDLQQPPTQTALPLSS